MHFFTLLTAALLTLTLAHATEPHATEPHAADPHCMYGIKSRKVCCPKACGKCGGPKCGVRSKMTKSLCCIGSILKSDYDCKTSPAPCKLSSTKPVDTPKPDPWCETGILKRSACCPAGCRTCGGKDCSKRGRMLKSDCCINSIKRRNNSCMKYGPPCVVTEKKMIPEPTPEPTKEPLPAVCSEMKTAFAGGCFCYLTIIKKILIKRRRKVINMCSDIFESRGAIKKFAPKCTKFIVGKHASERRMMLLEKINELIPICLPEGTPLIVLKH